MRVGKMITAEREGGNMKKQPKVGSLAPVLFIGSAAGDDFPLEKIRDDPLDGGSPHVLCVAGWKLNPLRPTPDP
jgi:hypothetical protein